MSAATILGIVGSILSAACAGAWALIQLWFKNQERIKMLEAKEVLDSVKALAAQLQDTKQEVRAYQLHLQDVKEKLMVATTKLDAAVKSEEFLGKSVEYMKEFVEKKVQDFQSTLSDGEIIRLGEGNRFMFKGKK